MAEEKRMTDSEIIKALECCISDKSCVETGCPLHNEKFCGKDFQILEKQALDLINRLQAENERLNFLLNDAYENNRGLVELLERAKAEAYKECIKKVKENFTEEFCGQKYDLIHSWFDNVLKELVGEDDDNTKRQNCI